MKPDNELLRLYTKTGSEAAFSELVQRHVNLVYSAALRQVGGDAHLAHDAAQSVFIDLARKAHSLARRSNLSGWLYTSAYFAAGKIARTENRRRQREEQFMQDPSSETAPEGDWQKLRPLLDDVMHDLNEADREAILLRYFENRAFADVGAKLNVNENTARMRVERALEKLRSLLAHRGITAGATLAAIISANAVQTAPASLATNLASASLAGAGTFTLSKLLTATKFKVGAGALVVAGALTALVVQHREKENLRVQNQQMSSQISQLNASNTELSNRLSSASNAETLTDAQLNELLKLRAEVARLRAAKESALTVAAPASGDPPQTNKTVITLNAAFIAVPADFLRNLQVDGLPGINGSGLLSDTQWQLIYETTKKSPEMQILALPRITTSSGVTASLSQTTHVPLNGTNADAGVMLDVTPFYSPDSSVFTLNIAAQLSQLSSDPSLGLLTTVVSNQTHLFPGQTVVMQEDLPAMAPLADSRMSPDKPQKLLIFLTPKIGRDMQKTASTSTQYPDDATARQAAIQKMTDARQGVLGMIMFASDNNGQLPTNIDQALVYLKDSSTGEIKTNFDMFDYGSLSNIPNPSSTIVLREKQAWQTPEGKWMKSYGFADGHSEIHTEPNGDFAQYEKAHILPQVQ